MDALIFLLAFAALILGLWFLGAEGLAIILAGCAVVVAIVESIWYFSPKTGKGDKDTVSKEVGRIWGVSRLRFYAVLALVSGGAIGLVVHLWAMRR